MYVHTWTTGQENRLCSCVQAPVLCFSVFLLFIAKRSALWLWWVPVWKALGTLAGWPDWLCTQGMTDGPHSHRLRFLSTPKLRLSMMGLVLPSYPHQSLQQDKLWFWGRYSGALGGALRWMSGWLVVGARRQEKRGCRDGVAGDKWPTGKQNQLHFSFIHSICPPPTTVYLSSSCLSLYFFLSPSVSFCHYVCLSFTHGTNHHRVPETEGDCGFVC